MLTTATDQLFAITRQYHYHKRENPGLIDLYIRFYYNQKAASIFYLWEKGQRDTDV